MTLPNSGSQIQPYSKYPDYAVMGRLPWSKNVNEERDAPQQLIFGSMDPHYDTLSLLGLWLEFRFVMHPKQNEFIFCVDGLEDPIRIKERIQKVLSIVLSNDQFHIRDVGLLGSHSIRKFGVTFARGNGCSKESLCFYSCLLPFSFFLIYLHDITRYVLFVFPAVMFLTIIFGSFRMTQTSGGAGKTPNGRMRLMLTPTFHTLMLKLKHVFCCSA